MAAAVDEAKLEELMGQLVGHMTGSALCFGIWLGDELGLYRTLVELGATSADDLAAKSGCHPRLVREWLDGQAAGGLLAWDEASDRYEIGPEAAMALADDESPAFVARAMNAHRLGLHRHAQGGRGVPGQRRAVVGRPPPVPVLGHRVVLPHRLPRRAPELDRRPRRRRREAARRGQRRRRRLRPRRVGRRARAGLPRGAHHRVRLPRPVDRHRRGAGGGGRRVGADRPSRSPTPRATTAPST